MAVSLEDVRSWGLKVSEDFYLVRFKIYREGGYFKVKTSRLFGLEAGIPKTCRAIIYLRGSSYEGALIHDESVRMHIPSFLIQLTKDNELWLYARKIEDEIIFFDEFEKKIDDYIIEFNPFINIVGSKSPRYSKGYKYCSKCEEAFLVNTKTCPRCGATLRSKPRRIKKIGIES